MAKTYNHKKRRRNSTRKSGGVKSSLYSDMSKGREEANKHYERSMKAYQPHADKLVSDMNKQYNKQKYKNTNKNLNTVNSYLFQYNLRVSLYFLLFSN